MASQGGDEVAAPEGQTTVIASQTPNEPATEKTQELHNKRQLMQGLGFTEAQQEVFLANETKEGPLLYNAKSGWIEGLLRMRSSQCRQLLKSVSQQSRLVDELRKMLEDCLAIAEWIDKLDEEEDLATRLPWEDDLAFTFSEKAAQLFKQSKKVGHKVLDTKDIVTSMVNIYHFNTQPGVENFYHTYAELFNYVRLWDQKIAALNLPRVSNADLYLALQSGVLQAQKHWSNDYIGSLPAEIVRTLLQWHNLETYSRFMPVMNSSGVGKSKAIDELSNCGPLVVGVVLRNPGDTGYPPGDPEVYQFFRNICDAQNFREGEMIAYAFVEAAIQSLQNWATRNGFVTSSTIIITDPDGQEVQQTTVSKSAGYNHEALMASWRTAMRPVEFEFSVLGNPKKRSEDDHDETDVSFDGTKSAEFISENCRSPGKKAFIRELVAHAETALKELREKTNWTKAKLFMQHDAVQERIRRNIEPLMSAIFPADEVEVLKKFLVLSIDEAAILFDDRFAMRTTNASVRDSAGVLYYNIRRALSGLQEYSVWCIPLSTRSNIENLVPAALKDPSRRVRRADQTRVPPFTIFPVDVSLRNRLAKNMAKELEKSLADYSCLDHLSAFGRILWKRFIPRAHPNDVNGFVLTKLLNEEPEDLAGRMGQVGSNIEVAAAFAMFASRIAIDDFSNITQARDLIRDSILSHLRLLKSFDQHSSRCSALSVTPSEPLVAQAVSGFLIQKNLWHFVIKAVCDKLLHPGLITKGDRGEIYVQLLLILARDFALDPRYRTVRQDSTVDTQRLSGSPPRQKHTTVMPAAGYFQLEQLLRGLLTPVHFEAIWNFEKDDGAGGKVKMGEVFKHAKLNFSHFSTASTHLFGDRKVKQTVHGVSIEEQRRLLSKNEFLQLLLYRQSGLQMALNQPEWDSAVAMYMGNADEPVAPKKLSCLYVQTKNVADGYTPRAKTTGKGKTIERLYQTGFSYFPVPPEQPKLGFIFNIGVSKEKTGVRNLPVDDPSVWYFDIRGSGPEVFKCVGHSDELAKACSDLLGALHPDTGLSDPLQQMVDTYEPFSRITFAGQALGEDEVRAD